MATEAAVHAEPVYHAAYVILHREGETPSGLGTVPGGAVGLILGFLGGGLLTGPFIMWMLFLLDPMCNSKRSPNMRIWAASLSKSVSSSW